MASAYCRASLIAASVASEPPRDEECAIEPEPGQIAHEVGERDVGVALEQARVGEGNRLGLDAHGLHHAPVAVTEVTDDGTGGGVEVAAPVSVPEIDALAPRDDRPPRRALRRVEGVHGPALRRVADAPGLGHGATNGVGSMNRRKTFRVSREMLLA